MAYRVEGYIFFVDKDNHAGEIAFSVLTLLLVAWFFIGARFWGSVWHREDSNGWHRDDSMLVLSTVLSSAACACASIAAWCGLGNDPKSFNQAQLITQNKSIMAMHIIYVVSVGLNKTSYLFISLRVLEETITSAYRNALRIVAAFIWVWVVLTGVAGLTGCPISGKSRTCFAEGRFSIPVAMVDCILEIACVGFPVTIVWKSQMRKTLKSQWYFIFGLRSIIVTVVMWRTDCMVALMQPTISDTVWSDRRSQATIATLVEMAFGIVSVTVPFIHPLILGLPSEPNIVGPDPVYSVDGEDSDSKLRALRVSITGLQSSAKLVPKNITSPKHKRTDCTPSAPYPSPASSTTRSMTSLAARSSVSLRESARNSTEFYAAVYL